MMNNSIFEFLPITVVVGLLLWQFVRSSHEKLQLSLKFAVIVGLIRLGLALLVVFVVVLLSFIVLTLLPAGEIFTFATFMIALVFSTLIAQQVDKRAQPILILMFK